MPRPPFGGRWPSGRLTRMPTRASAAGCSVRGSSTRRSRRTARPSGSARTRRRRTATLATRSEGRASWGRPMASSRAPARSHRGSGDHRLDAGDADQAGRSRCNTTSLALACTSRRPPSHSRRGDESGVVAHPDSAGVPDDRPMCCFAVGAGRVRHPNNTTLRGVHGQAMTPSAVRESGRLRTPAIRNPAVRRYDRHVLAHRRGSGCSSMTGRHVRPELVDRRALVRSGSAAYHRIGRIIRYGRPGG